MTTNMSQMIFAAFDDEGRARAALDRLRGDDFKEGGFSLLARQDFRNREAPRFGEGPKHSTLDPMIESMTTAPDLEVDNHEVAGVGALPNLLKPAPHAGLGGLQRALTEVGVDDGTAERFAATIRDQGLILGVATEDAQRGEQALRLLRNEGALALAEIDIADERLDRAP